MALGIHKEGIYDVLIIPLEWESNEILANHFRMLADEIARTKIEVLEVRISAPINQPYGKPCLEIKGFSKRERAE